MPRTSIDPLSAAFAALADPTRRAILARLALGDTRVGELVSPFAISGPAISRHLRVLEDARLIDRTVDAQWRICKLQPAGLQAANDWLTDYRVFWEQSLDRLVETLEQANPENQDKGADAAATSAAASGASTTPAPGAAQRRPRRMPRPNRPRSTAPTTNRHTRKKP